jgi:KUP system potassium uptake protein
MLLVSTITTDAPRVAPEGRVKLTPVGAGITRVLLCFGFMEHPDVMEGLKLARRDPSLRGIDPERIMFYSRRVMIVARMDNTTLIEVNAIAGSRLRHSGLIPGNHW